MKNIKKKNHARLFLVIKSDNKWYVL